MSSVLGLCYRQRVRPVNGKLFRQIARALLVELLEIPEFELGIHLVPASEMAVVNETYLQHGGSTDVITFDHSSAKLGTPNSEKKKLHGEIFICLDDAVTQAREFRTTWQSEVVRYLVHGVLHLLGYDDLNPAARRKMKHAENRLMRELSRLFVLSKLARRKSKS